MRATVDLLLACDAAATAVGAGQFAAPILQTAAGYFLQPQDYIPDQQGPYGLLDDAYLACRFVAGVSQAYAAATGTPLLDMSLDARSSTVRAVIGEPLASQLDRDVQQTLHAAAAQVRLAQMQPWPVQRTGWSDWAHAENAVNAEAEIASITSGWF